MKGVGPKIMKKKLLWVGDAGCPSGFARATHEILARICDAYDVTVLGLNYRGDPHPYPYPIYAAAPGGDSLGVGRLIWMCDMVRPDVIVFQNDGWFIPYYMKQLRARKQNGEYRWPEHAAIPVIATLAVDGKNFKGDWIKDVSLAVFWTEFALREAQIGGYAGPHAVIPLGVDLNVYHPVERDGALDRQKATGLRGRFVVGNVNRNQHRKRLDLTLKYFAEWVHSHKIPDASLFIYAAPTGDDSLPIVELARYYGILDRLAFTQPELFYGNSEESMRDTYNCFDVQVTTTQGEGFGLTTFEGMACGVPQILPAWSALEELCRGAAAMVPCTSTAMQSTSSVNGMATIGGVADQRVFIQALQALYSDKHHREAVAHLGMARVEESRFRWEDIGERWIAAIDSVVADPVDADMSIWQEPMQAQVEEV